MALAFALSPATAQVLPGAVWGETTVEVVAPSFDDEVSYINPVEDTDAPTQSAFMDINDLPPILQHEQVLDLNRHVASATVPVRAIFRRHPAMMPNVIEVDGAATWIDRGDGSEPILLTASFLVNGAESVEIVTPDGIINADASIDARYGLAVLTPEQTITPEATLPLSQARAETTGEAFGPLDGSFGNTLGAAANEAAYYQLNNTGVTLGYPVTDREGNLVGIGSHYLPSDPSFSLSIPADSVDQYLSTLVEDEPNPSP